MPFGFSLHYSLCSLNQIITKDVWKKNPNDELYPVNGINSFDRKVFDMFHSSCNEMYALKCNNKIGFVIRSLSNLHSQKSRSMKSVKIPWYQKPIVRNNKYLNVQRGAFLTSLFAFVSIDVPK